MKKIQYTIYKRDTGNASGKAKKDCLDTLERLGFIHLYRPSDKRTVRVLQQIISLSILSLKKEKKVFVYQYPAAHKNLYHLILKALHKEDVTITVIHDLLALQNDINKEILEDEIHFLNHFKYIIVPNKSMLSLLKKNGCSSFLIDMEIYDYIHECQRAVRCDTFSNTICFAGNLEKSRFLQYLEEIKSVNFLLYGKNGERLSKDNTKYMGCFPAEELVYLLEGDYGLVWDGDSLDECTGTAGRYLLYNSPHKLSSYIAAGKPVITWDEAAIAAFVKKYDIGIVVSSLRELENIDLQKNYRRYKENVMELKNNLAVGYYLEKAIDFIFTVENL